MIKSIKAMCAYRKRVTCKEFTMTIDGLNPIQGQQSSVPTERMRGQQQHRPDLEPCISNSAGSGNNIRKIFKAGYIWQ